MNILKSEIQQCNVCSPFLELGVRPIFSVSASSKILIIGQAPGIVVHKSGVPWNDKSGENLRRWLGIDETTFYDSSKIGIVPMVSVIRVKENLAICHPEKNVLHYGIIVFLKN